ncbi:MAG: hypothetical protein AAFQ33_02800 [Pseudomonadota bacterium]
MLFSALVLAACNPSPSRTQAAQGGEAATTTNVLPTSDPAPEPVFSESLTAVVARDGTGNLNPASSEARAVSVTLTASGAEVTIDGLGAPLSLIPPSFGDPTLAGSNATIMAELAGPGSLTAYTAPGYWALRPGGSGTDIAEAAHFVAGDPTPDDEIPFFGEAQFSGVLSGSVLPRTGETGDVVMNTVTGEVTLEVDFFARRVSGGIEDVFFDGPAASGALNDIALDGVLTGSAFFGTATVGPARSPLPQSLVEGTTGPFDGTLNGPDAAEFGGVITLADPDTVLIGAIYGLNDDALPVSGGGGLPGGDPGFPSGSGPGLPDASGSGLPAASGPGSSGLAARSDPAAPGI